jgi:hypothetical protein
MGKRLSDLPAVTALATDSIVGLRIAGIRVSVQSILDLAGSSFANVAVTGNLTLTCPDDGTTHVVRVRKVGSEYVLEIAQ